MTPIVSIITPTYNRLHDLQELWASLKNQTLTNFEWIVIDDGGTDGTGDWMKSLMPDKPSKHSKHDKHDKPGKHSKGDPRLVYHWQENHFMGHARNRGMDRMRGDYAIFLDSDDKFSSNKSLATMVEAIANAPPEVGRVIFPADCDPHRLAPDTVLLLDYAEFACRIKKMLTYTYLSITRSAIAKQFPWQENRAFSDVRDYDIARHCKYMLVNKIVWHYQRDRSKADADNAGAFLGFVRQMPDLIDNVSLLIARHKQVWLAHCRSIYAERCYEVAFFISLTGTFTQHFRLPALILAVLVYDDWRSFWRGGSWRKRGWRVKALVLLATLLLPQHIRLKLYGWRYRKAHSVPSKLTPPPPKRSKRCLPLLAKNPA